MHGVSLLIHPVTIGEGSLAVHSIILVIQPYLYTHTSLQ